jgi:hypothetical protein
MRDLAGAGDGDDMSPRDSTQASDNCAGVTPARVAMALNCCTRP